MSNAHVSSGQRESSSEPLFVSFQMQEVQMVVWLLKHCLLMQLHTYVFLVPGAGETSQRNTYHAHHSHNPHTNSHNGLLLPPDDTRVADSASGSISH